MLEIIEIDFDSDEYQEERELRNKILLRPFGLPDHAWEMKDEEAFHLVAKEGGKLVGCLLLWPNNCEELQLMQMAVDNTEQGRGIGRKLVGKAKEISLERGYVKIYCHARENAIAFYEKQGFEFMSDWFEEVGIKHRKMYLELF